MVSSEHFGRESRQNLREVSVDITAADVREELGFVARQALLFALVA